MLFGLSKKQKLADQFVCYIRQGSPIFRYDDSSCEEFCESLLSIGKKIGSYVLFPSGERILRWAISKKEELKQHGVIIPTVGIEIYKEFSDKFKFANICKNYNLHVPDEYDSIPDKYAFKFVVKPKEGIWGRDNILTVPFLVENSRSLELLKKKNLDRHSHFIQQYIDGPSYYYCGLYEEGHKKLGMAQKTLIQQPGGGSVIKAKIDHLPDEIVEKVDKMLLSLGWQGLLMVEFKELNDKYYAIECNPRLWGPLQLAVDNGFDFPYALWCLTASEEIKASNRLGRSIGYRWAGGYLFGWLARIETGTDFQRNDGHNVRETVFRDIWLRMDTLIYFVVEFMFLCKKMIRAIMRR